MKKLLAVSEKISKYLIAATLIIVPLLPKFPLIRVPGTYVSIRFEDLLLLILAVILIPKILLNFKSIIKDPIISAFLIFIAVGFVSLLAGNILTKTVDLRLGILHWARRIEYFTPFFAAYLLIPKKNIMNHINFYLKILLMVVLIIFLYGIGQHLFRFPVIITQNDEYSKGIALFWTKGSNTNSTFAGQYDLAAFMVMVIPFFLTTLFVIKDKFVKLFAFIASGTGLWLLVNSLSRMGQLAYLFAVSASLLLLRKFKGLAIILLVSIVFMAMSTSLSSRFGQAIYVIYQRIAVGKSFSYIKSHFVALADQITFTATPTPVPVRVIQDVSIAIRANVEWPRAFRAITKNPLLGTGYSSIGLATDNDYLRALAETGLLGLLAFVLIFYRIGKMFMKVYPFRVKLSGIELAYITGTLGAMVGTFLIATFIDIFEASKFAIIFWLLLGCALNLIKSKEYAE